ncbi:uncharacterized protein KD926_009901 [Aspergillus affinis]|uniref:uncharacterized protein n=1 Tax=Aspergillus affinis TaxID=1070780 RepID=UPI0022FEF18C|nr:uncharacterized protein KD926_009901 [Aspergillus affinis]KAI9039152.1 hypothetical protein KD926_009901 [Aspergillus affinis]
MHLRAHFPLHQHTVSANSVPTYANRTVPSYSVAGEEGLAESRSMAAPRYSPNVQPWRRQNTQNSLSFVPSTSPRLEQSEYTTSQQTRRPAEQAPVIISPFRSVRRMKQPFQLRLPSSPSFENNPSSVRDSRRLSREPFNSNNHGLRTWRSDQNLTTTSMETFGLLPSPPLSDPRSSQPSPSSAYFSPKSEYDSDADQTTPKSSSTYKPEPKPSFAARALRLRKTTENLRSTNESTNVHMAHSNLVRQWDSDDGKLTPVSTDSERTASPSPSPSRSPSLSLSPTPSTDIDSPDTRDFSISSTNSQRSRSRTVSSERSWVPSSLSYYEPWLQGAPAETADSGEEKPKEFNRRKCQILPPADKPVVFAVASKTKPKLVDISRQSSPAMSYSMPTPTQRTAPSTPDHRQHEISAFSPDTPLEMSDSGYITHHCPSPKEHQTIKEEDEYTDTSSLNGESVGETVICDKMATSQEIPRLPPKSPQRSPQRSPAKPDLKPTTQSSPKAQASPGRSSNTSEKEELEKWWDHEWTIDQLEHSAKDFPRNMLKLTSPVIMFLRHNNEKALIRPFRKIFPEVAENLLDNLCAVLIARNYLISLASINRRNSNFSHKPSLSRLDTVPEKASSGLGMQYSQPTPARVKNRILGARSTELCKDLDRIVDNLIFAICGKHDEHLKSSVLVLAQVLETKS